MIIDAQNKFSEKQAVAAPAVSENVIDLKVDGNVGVGEPMAVVVVLPTGTADNGDEVYGVTLQTDSVEGFGSSKDIASKAIDRGLAAGSKVVLGVPADDSADRFLRLSYAASGTGPSMEVTAFLIPQSMVQNDYKFASGFAVAE